MVAGHPAVVVEDVQQQRRWAVVLQRAAVRPAAVPARLGRQRWLVGDRFSEADLRLFPTLLRFDTVYYVLFKCNRRRLIDYPNLWNYTREIYQMPGVAETVDFARIKLGYYGGMRHLNNGILPLGPDLDFAAPHDRGRL